MRRWVLLLTLTLPCVAAPPRKLYTDRANGVSFSYPANWLLNGDDDAATAKFRITSQGQPSVVVQLEGNFAESGPYKGTDFESGAFTYIVITGGTEASCFAALDQTAEGKAAVPALWNGIRARRLDSTYTVAGTDDIHRAVAVFRNDRCYLFETVLIHTNKDAVVRPLDPVRWNQVHAAFDSVLGSVRIVKPVKTD